MKNSLLSKKNRKLLSDPLGDQNPITIQVLGICSALAITVQLQQALVMSMSVVFVMVCGNMIISALRNVIPSRIRIIVQLVVVSSLVVFVDQVLQAFLQACRWLRRERPTSKLISRSPRGLERYFKTRTQSFAAVRRSAQRNKNHNTILARPRPRKMNHNMIPA